MTSRETALPYAVKHQREKNNWYIVDNEPRFWTGHKLLCSHKKCVSVCTICSERTKQKKKANKQILNSPETALPVNWGNMVNGTFYILKGEARLWQHNHLYCVHVKKTCQECTAKNQKEKMKHTEEKEKGKKNALPFEPLKKLRTKGTWYVVKGVVRKWNGYFFTCAHGRDEMRCRFCKLSKESSVSKEEIVETIEEIVEFPLIKKQRIEGKRYKKDGEVRIWKHGVLRCPHEKFFYSCLICSPHLKCEHNRIWRECLICKKTDKYRSRRKNRNEYADMMIDEPTIYPFLPRFIKERTIGSKYNLNGEIVIWSSHGIKCRHDKAIHHCSACGPEKFPDLFCQTCKFNSISKKKSRYYPQCTSCYFYSHPEAERKRNYLVRETEMIKEIMKAFPDVTLTRNRQISDGCSKHRPDCFIDLGSHALVCECDEDHHRSYKCENKRMMSLFTDCNYRKLVLIRVNPDAFKDEFGTKHSSCFYLDKKHRLQIDENGEWNQRISKLIETMDYHIKNEPEKDFTEIKLFYPAVEINKDSKREISDQESDFDCDEANESPVDYEEEDDGSDSDDESNDEENDEENDSPVDYDEEDDGDSDDESNENEMRIENFQI